MSMFCAILRIREGAGWPLACILSQRSKLRSLREELAGGEGAFATWVDAAGLAWRGAVAEAGSKLRSLREALVGGEGAFAAFVDAAGSAWRGAVAEAGVVVVGAVGVDLDDA